MQVKSKISPSYKEIEIHICNDKLDEQVRALTAEIAQVVNGKITGHNENGAKILLLHEIIRFYAQNQKVLAQSQEGLYSIHEKLYELEEKLDSGQFLRISKSEIVNIRKIRKLDSSVTGTIKVILVDGTETYTSRRNVSSLKQALGIKEKKQ